MNNYKKFNAITKRQRTQILLLSTKLKNLVLIVIKPQIGAKV